MSSPLSRLMAHRFSLPQKFRPYPQFLNNAHPHRQLSTITSAIGSGGSFQTDFNSCEAISHAVTPLNNQGIVRLFGKDSFSFLQGMITSDLNTLNNHYLHGIYASLLSMKGRYLHDMFISKEQGAEDSFLIDLKVWNIVVTCEIACPLFFCLCLWRAPFFVACVCVCVWARHTHELFGECGTMTASCLTHGSRGGQHSTRRAPFVVFFCPVDLSRFWVGPQLLFIPYSEPTYPMQRNMKQYKA